MPKKTEYAQGTPDWVDLQTTDQAAAKSFYASLFGWSYDDRPMGPDAVYSMATLNGDTVAAIAPMPPGLPDGIPPMWNTYIAVDDVDAAVARVQPAGGQVLMPPADETGRPTRPAGRRDRWIGRSAGGGSAGRRVCGPKLRTRRRPGRPTPVAAGRVR